MFKSPIQTSFDPPDVPCSLWVQNSVIRVLFWLDFQKHSRTFHDHLINTIKSCNSDNDTPMSVAALGDEKWKFLYFCSYLLLFGILRAPRDVLYIVGKVFLKEIQRCWDRSKRFSSYGVNPRTSFTDLGPEGDLSLFPCLGLLAAWLGHMGTLDISMASDKRGTDFSIEG